MVPNSGPVAGLLAYFLKGDGENFGIHVHDLSALFFVVFWEGESSVE